MTSHSLAQYQRTWIKNKRCFKYINISPVTVPLGASKDAKLLPQDLAGNHGVVITSVGFYLGLFILFQTNVTLQTRVYQKSTMLLLHNMQFHHGRIVL